MNHPINQLCVAAQRIAAGELSVTVPQNRNDELGRLAKTFNAMTRTLAVHEETKSRMAGLERQAMLSEMAAMVAHEIRNPLNLIGLTADHLTHICPLQNFPDQPESVLLLKNIKEQVVQMNRMVEQFITIGKPLQLHRERFLIEPFFVELQTMLKPQLIDKNCSIVHRPDC